MNSVTYYKNHHEETIDCDEPAAKEDEPAVAAEEPVVAGKLIRR